MRVWECRIVIDDDQVLPAGFDFPPRRAAIAAVEAHGVRVKACFSGWGHQTNPDEDAYLEYQEKVRDAYKT